MWYPVIAIREGVYKSFQVTQEHFAEEYGKKIRFFIYNSAQLTEIDRFASDSSINVHDYQLSGVQRPGQGRTGAFT